jgi:hypothetical protein
VRVVGIEGGRSRGGGAKVPAIDLTVLLPQRMQSLHVQALPCIQLCNWSIYLVVALEGAEHAWDCSDYFYVPGASC